MSTSLSPIMRTRSQVKNKSATNSKKGSKTQQMHFVLRSSSEDSIENSKRKKTSNQKFQGSNPVKLQLKHKTSNRVNNVHIY